VPRCFDWSGVEQLSGRTGNKQKHETKNPLQRALINRFHRKAVAMVEKVKPESILDLGCGGGYTMAALKAAGIKAEFNGIDLSEAALVEAKERLGEDVSLRCCDILELTEAKEKHDLVMMLEVIEHITQPERVVEVLKAVGSKHLLLSVPREPFFRGLNFARGKNIRRWGDDPEHVNHWSRRGFIRWIGQYFDVIESPGVFPWTMVLVRIRDSED